MSLALRYAFVPSPNPIRASAPQATSFVDLMVIVSNPHAPVALAELSIEIGDKSASGVLSTSALPSPAPSPLPGGWACEVDGHTLLLTPPSQILAPLTFTLPHIEVDETAGTVPITIQEAPPQGPTLKDATSYSLVKQPSDCVVTNFWSDPPTVDAANSPVTLAWTVTALGGNSEYQVRSGDGTVSGPFAPDASGRCSTRIAELQRTEEFVLVRLVRRGGKLEARPVADLVVRLDAPWVSPYSRVDVTGSIATLRWATSGVERCVVYVAGREVDADAPADTWVHGYPLFIGITEDGRDVRLEGHGASATASRYPFDFGAVAVGAPRRVTGGAAGSGAVAVDAHGAHAYVGVDAGFVEVDLATGTARGPLAGGMIGPFPCTGLAWVPGLRLLALIAAWPDRSPIFVTWDPMSPDAWADLWLQDEIGHGPGQAVAAAQSVLYGAYHGPRDLSVAHGKSAPDVTFAAWWQPGDVCSLAATTDGTSLVAGGAGGQIRLFDVTSGPFGPDVPPPIPLGDGPAIAAAAAHVPVAAVACGGARTLTAIAAPHPRVSGQPIELPGTPTALALAPDGKLAFVGFADGGVVSVDLGARTVVGAPFAMGFPVAGIGVSPIWPKGPVIVTGAGGEIALL